MAKAYVNKRDKFLWDNSFKPEDKIPVPAVSDVGKAVVVDADGDYTLGDVSTEDEIVYVHFIETTSTLVDYTFAQVKALLDAGKHVVLIRDNANVRAYYELYSYYNNEAIFTNQRTLEYLSEDTLFAYNVVINFTNETLTQYTSRYSLEGKIYDTAIAYEYNTVRNYTVGEYCMYEGKLHRCINNTTGNFVVADWTVTNVMREIPKVQYNYSTTERVVGTWIDGKPLYEKTFITTVVISNRNTWYNADDVTDLHIDSLVHFESTFGSTGHTIVTNVVCGQINNNYIQVMSLEPWGINSYTIRYTKTTD